MKFIGSFVLYLCILLIAFWIIGFGVFCLYSLSLKYASKQSADAIVVLTGGEDRITTAVDLLKKSHADYLLISGVNKKVSLSDFDKLIDPEIRAKITLGYQATNTRENAQETAQWIKGKAIQSVLLVTSFYHMPRSIFEMLSAAPHLTIIPHPVFPKRFENSVDWIKTRSAWLLFVEYHKLIAIVFYQFLKGYLP